MRRHAGVGPKTMTLIYLSIPLMIVAVAVAVVPLLWAMRRQNEWDEDSPAHLPIGWELTRVSHDAACPTENPEERAA